MMLVVLIVLASCAMLIKSEDVAESLYPSLHKLHYSVLLLFHSIPPVCHLILPYTEIDVNFSQALYSATEGSRWSDDNYFKSKWIFNLAIYYHSDPMEVEGPSTVFIVNTMSCLKHVPQGIYLIHTILYKIQLRL